MKKFVLLTAFVALASLSCASGTAGSSGTISPEEAKALLASDPAVVLMDVREASEYAEGHIAKALLLPYGQINAATAAQSIPAKDSTVVVYCRSGRRSAIAATSLRELGYTKVLDLGGISSWPYERVQGDKP